jgi:hypothetical protein
MNWSDIRTLDDLSGVDLRFADELVGKSKDFHQPDCPNVRWEVERKPFNPQVLVLRPSRPISRAWDVIFRIVLDKLASARLVPYHVSPQTNPPNLYIELPDDDRDDSRRVAEAVNAATEVANPVSTEAAAECDREHERLARDLGLNRQPIGFVSGK